MLILLFYIKKWSFATISSTVATLFIVAAAVAATSFSGEGTVPFDSIRVGQQGVGGVTFFNGTIVNQTTGDGGSGVPIMIGDDVRIDGRVWRGATPGTGDSQPFIVNDNMQVTGNLSVGSLEGDVVTADNLADGAVGTDVLADGAVGSDALADGSVTAAKVSGAGGAGLPIAYGYVRGSDAAILAGTSNFDVVRDDIIEGMPMYWITIDGEDYDPFQYVTVATSMADGGWPQAFGSDGQMIIYFQDENGDFVDSQGFYFITYRTDAADSASVSSSQKYSVGGKKIKP